MLQISNDFNGTSSATHDGISSGIVEIEASTNFLSTLCCKNNHPKRRSVCFVSNGQFENYHTEYYGFDERRRQVWKAICEDIQRRYINGSGVVLDLGCGYGDFINQVEARTKVAVDIADMSRFLEKYVVFHQQNIQDLSFIKDGTVNTVFCSNILEHLDRQEIDQVLKETRRVMSANGALITLQPHFRFCYKRYFDDYTHVSIFTDKSLAGLLSSAGFKILDVKAKYLPFSMQGILPKSYWLTKIYLTLGVRIMAKQMLIVASKSN